MRTLQVTQFIFCFDSLRQTFEKGSVKFVFETVDSVSDLFVSARTFSNTFESLRKESPKTQAL